MDCRSGRAWPWLPPYGKHCVSIRRYQYTAFPANGFCRFHRFLTARVAWKTVGSLIRRENLDFTPPGKRSKTVRKRFLLEILRLQMRAYATLPSLLSSNARILPPVAPATYY